jgi:DNA (cytosine-5)-methyltransferase 1
MANSADARRVVLPLFSRPLFGGGVSVSATPAPAGWIEELGVEPGPAWPDRFGAALREQLGGSHSIRALSLFAGGGGLDIGFHDCGIEIVEAVELEQKYVATLEANAGPGGCLEGTTPRCIDIRQYSPPQGIGQIDLVIGGPPCQTFSAAGRRASGVAGISDPRGVLFEEYVRLLAELRPTAFVFENVYGIVGAQGGEAWRAIQAGFSEIGYRIHHRIVDAADYGAPQHRERLIIVGTHDHDYRFPRPTHGPDSAAGRPFHSAGEAVAGADSSEASKGLGGQHGHLLDEIPPGLNYSFFTAKLGHPRPVFAWRSKFSDYLYKADPDAPVRTIKAQGGQYTGPFSWENRRFSIAELKRLQTFPDDYEVVGGRQVAIEQIGNSVPPQVARILALSVLEQVFDVESPVSLGRLDPEEKLGFRSRKRFLTASYAEKAALAHAAGGGNGRAVANGRGGRATRYLGDDFRWSASPLTDAEALHTHLSRRGADWKLDVFTGSALGKPQFEIEVRAAAEAEWGIPARSVRLRGQRLDGKLFTAAWRRLEEAMQAETGIDDLVQLNGYYQYAPRLRAGMSVAPEAEPGLFWQLVGAVVEGRGVGVTAPLKELSGSWGLGATSGELKAAMLRLRRIGYEIRSHNTNPQIPRGSYLVPYAFPTLTHQSVQLRKRL